MPAWILPGIPTIEYVLSMLAFTGKEKTGCLYRINYVHGLASF